jgi:hypothetical protein
MTSPSPGWYDDGTGAQRWWDGARWTDHTQVAAPEGAPAPTTPAVSGEYPPEAGGPASSAYAPTEPRKSSKLWIVWAAIGVVVLGLVIAAAVLIPMMLGAITAGGGSAVPANADEQAAVDAVELYDEAWRNADCDSFQEATTEAFRNEVGLADCAAFDASAQTFGQSVGDYELTVTSISRKDGIITVGTNETYQALTDEENQPLATPVPSEVNYEYYVIADGDRWAIDDAASD